MAEIFGQHQMTDKSRDQDSQGAAHPIDADEAQVPVIQVWQGILALPIVGTLDTMRAQEMNEVLLEKVIQTGAEIVILDVTGVPLIDTAIAKHLLETVSAARLLGCEVMIVGLSARTAMTMVHLGLDLSMVTTRSTMAKGLEMAFARLGLEVVRSKDAPARPFLPDGDL